jgi:AraC family transcriptional regulator of adaptative response/methylated-DNA-[protein]-cysteine methyltransferase
MEVNRMQLMEPRTIDTATTLDPDALWRAVEERDRNFDGTFFLAVKTTGVYCRPTCPARTPLRRNVEFYRTPDEAEAAGFRACRRCHPRGKSIDDAQLELVQRACAHIEAHLDETLTLENLGAALGVSPYHLQRTFKRITGVSPRSWAENRRLEQVKTQLREGDEVTRALYDAGFGSSSRLYERAPQAFGMTPTTYRKGGAGMTIGYTIVDCRLGRLLVAATERGICMLSIGERDEPLVEGLTREYPMAAIGPAQGEFAEWVDALVRHLAGQEPHLELPTDVQATAFQRQVWEALRAIPYGATRSYSDVARAIGRPTAVRAVAQACATNPTAIVVPCHRVVREDGSLGGYRWGVERKRALLETEQATAHAG